MGTPTGVQRSRPAVSGGEFEEHLLDDVERVAGGFGLVGMFETAAEPGRDDLVADRLGRSGDDDEIRRVQRQVLLPLELGLIGLSTVESLRIETVAFLAVLVGTRDRLGR